MLEFLQSSFLFAGLAIAIPLAIHLFFRLKTKRVRLGTIYFLRRVLEENARRRKVMRWALLALRIGAVLLLALLFARPFLAAAPVVSGAPLVLVLIDQSASMQLVSDRERLIDRAVQQARTVLEQAGVEARCEVAFFDSRIVPLEDLGEGSASNQARTLAALANWNVPKTAAGSTNYAAAMEWARERCLQETERPRHLHLFTDLQRSGLDWPVVEPLPPGVESHLHDVGQSVVNNVAVTEARPIRTWIRPSEKTNVRVTVTYDGAFTLEDVPVVLEFGRATPPSDVPASSSPVPSADLTSLRDRQSQQERIKLEPGASVTLEFELPELGEGTWQGRVSLDTSDDLSFDNVRYFAVSATPAYKVLVLHGDDGPAVMRESYFLETALRLAPEDQEFPRSPFAPVVQTVDGASPLPELADFDAVVLADLPDLASKDAGRLAQFVSDGGGLLIFTGENITPEAGTNLARAGLTVGSVGPTRITSDLPFHWDTWRTDHPILAPLSDPQQGDLRRIPFAAYTPLTPGANTTVLARFNTGDPLLLERSIGSGRLLLVATSCGRLWSDWCRSRLFLPTVHQLLGYQVGLSDGGRIRSAIIGGQSSTDPSVVADATEDVALPNASTLTAASSAAGSISPVGSADTNETVPGFVSQQRFTRVVNVNPRESDVDRCTAEDLQQRFSLLWADEPQPTPDTVPAMGLTDQRHNELWPWVALALLCLVLTESLVANRTTA